MSERKDSVEVVYATPEVQRIVQVAFKEGLTAIQAVERTGFLDEFPEIRSDPLVLGVFGESAEPHRKLSPGDRVEICRPLKQDPREMRSSLAAGGGVMGRAKDGQGD